MRGLRATRRPWRKTFAEGQRSDKGTAGPVRKSAGGAAPSKKLLLRALALTEARGLPGTLINMEDSIWRMRGRAGRPNGC